MRVRIATGAAVGLAALSTTAWGAEPVTFADLEGAVIEARIVRHQVVRREGRDVPVRFQNDVKLVIGPGEKIEMVVTPMSDTPRGRRHGPPRKSSHTLERPKTLSGLGGGHGVHVFSDETLTFLRTYKGGAFKRTIAFVRGREGLSCTANEAFARENSVGALVMESAIDGVPVTIVSAKQLSSSCRVVKQAQPPATQ